MQKRGIIIIIIVVLVLGIFLGYNYSNQQQVKHFKGNLEESYDSLGWKFYREGKYDAAVAEFKKYIKSNKNNFFAHTGLGWSLYKKGIYDEATDSFETAISLKQDDYLPYSGLGWSYYNLKDYKNYWFIPARLYKFDDGYICSIDVLRKVK